MMSPLFVSEWAFRCGSVQFNAVNPDFRTTGLSGICVRENGMKGRMEMGRQRRRFTDTFKAEVAIEAVKGVKTLAELAAEYQVHPNQISDWKKLLLTNAPTLFASGKRSLGKTEEELTAPLYEEIGRLKMDLKWLEKKL